MIKDKINQYGYFGIIQLTIDFCLTKLFFSKARIIRFPIDIRGNKFISISNGLTTGRYCRIEAYPNNNKSTVIIFGENVQMNDFVHITAMNKVHIGNNVLLASKIYISDCSHGFYEGNENDSSPFEHPINRKYKVSEVIIKDNVWIGESVSVLPGVTIGQNSIIGANSVVTKDIPDNCIAVGNPAKVVKKYNLDKKVWERI
jgi:lipopolysaccharide O-acetyltransferase